MGQERQALTGEGHLRDAGDHHGPAGRVRAWPGRGPVGVDLVLRRAPHGVARQVTAGVRERVRRPAQGPLDVHQVAFVDRHGRDRLGELWHIEGPVHRSSRHTQARPVGGVTGSLALARGAIVEQEIEVVDGSIAVAGAAGQLGRRMQRAGEAQRRRIVADKAQLEVRPPGLPIERTTGPAVEPAPRKPRMGEPVVGHRRGQRCGEIGRRDLVIVEPQDPRSRALAMQPRQRPLDAGRAERDMDKDICDPGIGCRWLSDVARAILRQDDLVDESAKGRQHGGHSVWRGTGHHADRQGHRRGQ